MATEEIPSFSTWRRSNKTTKNEIDDLVCYFCSIGDIQTLKRFAETGVLSFIASQDIKLAIRSNKFETVAWLSTHPLIYEHWQGDSDPIAEAARQGNLEIIKHLLDKGFAMDEWTFIYAVLYRKINVLNWMRSERVCPWYDDTEAHAQMEEMPFQIDEIFDWAVTKAGFPYVDIADGVYEGLAFDGDLETLKLIREQNMFPLSREKAVCAAAAEEGNLDVLKWLHEIVGCEWDETTCLNAVKRNHLEVLKYCLQNKCPWNRSWCLFVASGSPSCKKTYDWILSSEFP